ncbi:beta-lactamase family protein, partial [Streptomyces sp. EL5]|nr:beta-lactamase family protein [Streptomyces sp. EL5]
MTVHGYHDLRFESVREAFAELLAAGQTRGAALCVQVGGETVLDLWGGMADKD